MNKKTLTFLHALVFSAVALHAETELKLVLSPAGFKALRTYFMENQTTPSQGAAQTNYYIDTSRLDLRRMGISLRLRIKGSAASISVKVDGAPPPDTAETVDDVVSKVEYQCTLSDGLETATKIVGGRMDLLYALNNETAPRSDSNTLHPLDFLKARVFNGEKIDAGAGSRLRWSQIATRGTNSTLRQAFQFEVAGMERKVELDRTHFPAGYVGYEFEMELPQDTSVEEQERVRKAIHELFSTLGILYKASIKGKASTTFIILGEDKEMIGRLLEHGQISHASGDPF